MKSGATSVGACAGARSGEGRLWPLGPKTGQEFGSHEIVGENRRESVAYINLSSVRTLSARVVRSQAGPDALRSEGIQPFRMSAPGPKPEAYQIGGAARCIRHDNCDGARRISLRFCDARDGREGDSARGQVQEFSTCKFIAPSIYAVQKSGLSARGAKITHAEPDPCVFSAHIASGHSPNTWR